MTKTARQSIDPAQRSVGVRNILYYTFNKRKWRLCFLAHTHPRFSCIMSHCTGKWTLTYFPSLGRGVKKHIRNACLGYLNVRRAQSEHSHPLIMADICGFANVLRFFVACKTKRAPWDCREAALAILCYFICKYMQILHTHTHTRYICVISSQKKMSTLLYFGLHCSPYFLSPSWRAEAATASGRDMSLVHISLSLPASYVF